MKKVLIIAYYFPPMGMGGTQRIAKFVKYLPQFGWQPIVLTVKDIAYYAFDDSLMNDVLRARIHRTGSLDPQRILFLLKNKRRQQTFSQTTALAGRSILSKLLNWIFIPDNKILWLPFAFFTARKLIQSEKITHIMTSSPPHSIQLLGLVLKRLFKVNWLVDFRDGWSEGNFQDEPTSMHRAINRRLEKMVLQNADAVVSVSSGLTEKISRDIKPENKFYTITNGFDLEDIKAAKAGETDTRFRITYSGTISEIAPMQDLLQAFSRLLAKNPELKKRVLLQLVGMDLAGNTKSLVKELGLTSHVEFTGYLNHRKAVARVLQADLLIYPVAEHASGDFIPGKTYEYLASGKPVLVIGKEIEGVRILKKQTEVKVIENENISAIEESLLGFIKRGRKESGVFDFDAILKYERKSLTRELAAVLDELNLKK